MLRGYRGFLLAVVGWLSLGAQHPQPATKAQQTQSAAQLDASTSRIVEAINNIAREQDAGCEDRKDKRSSDLCAQWKAADAARDAANYTWLAVGLSFLGTVLVALTFWEQRKVSRAELRAYVSVDSGSLEQWVQEDGSRKVEFNFTLKNAGITPAYKVVHMGNVYIFTPKEARAYFAKPAELRNRIGEPHSLVVHNGLELPGSVCSHIPIPNAKFAQVVEGEASLYAFGIVEYLDAFKKKRITRFCYELTPEAFRAGDPIAKSMPGVEHPIEWLVAPFHNDAT